MILVLKFIIDGLTILFKLFKFTLKKIWKILAIFISLIASIFLIKKIKKGTDDEKN